MPSSFEGVGAVDWTAAGTEIESVRPEQAMDAQAYTREELDRRSDTRRGQCRLCGAEHVELRDSHILPRWAYKRMRDPRVRNPNPIRVGMGAPVQTSRQLTEHLLCSACEQKFSRDEDFIARLTRVADGRSHLSTLLGPRRRRPETELATADASAVEVESVTRFAASVLWRSHACRITDKVDLGPYAETLRRYLHESEPLPPSLSLFVVYYEDAHASGSRLALVSMTPDVSRHENCRRYSFLVSGLQFVFHVGARIPDVYTRNCVIHSSAKIFFTGSTPLLMTQLDQLAARGGLVRA
jgi:hypothetical protein